MTTIASGETLYMQTCYSQQIKDMHTLERIGMLVKDQYGELMNMKGQLREEKECRSSQS